MPHARVGREPSAAVTPPPYRHLVEVGSFEDEEFEPLGVVRVTTESSIWFVTAERYQRLPREERPRPRLHSIENRLADGTWHGLRRCWWRVHDDGDRQMRILPEAGAADGIGIVTGVIVEVKGSWSPSAPRSTDRGTSADALSQ